MKIIKQAEEEFGKPFREIVQELADSGESINAAAYIIGYASPTSFRRHVKRLGIEFVKGSQSVGAMESRKSAGSTPAKVASAINAGKHNPTYYKVEINGITDTLAGHARRIGISKKTVYNRIAAGYSPKDALKKISYVRSPGTKNHHWRQDLCLTSPKKKKNNI